MNEQESESSLKGKQQRYAARLRKQLEAGEALSDDDAAWLEAYDASKGKPGRKRAPAPPLENAAAPDGDIPSDSPSGARHDPPPIDVRSPEDEGSAGESDAKRSDPEPQAASSGEPSSAHSEQEERAHEAKCLAAARAAAEWVKREHMEFARRGMFSLSPEVCEGFTPIFYLAFHEYFPKKTSPRAAAVATGVILGGTLIGKRYVRIKDMQTKRTQGPKGETYAPGSHVSEKPSAPKVVHEGNDQEMPI